MDRTTDNIEDYLKFTIHHERFILMLQMLKVANDNFDAVAMQYPASRAGQHIAQEMIDHFTKVYKLWAKMNI